MTTAPKLDAPPVSPDQVLTSVNLVCAADIKVRPILWSWLDWLPRGKLVVLAGAGGTGKTTLALGLAATITTAGRWPDGTPCRDHGQVLIWSSEDDPADTIVPRLLAAGADLSRVHIIDGAVTPEGEHLPFDPATHIDMLRRAVTVAGGMALLIVDPIVSAVAGDMHKANDVRRSLQALVDFASEFDCTVLGISHFAKGSGGRSPAERVIGSQAFGALARMVLVAAKDESSSTRVLARAKSNIGPDDGGFSYSMEQVALAAGIEASRVVWGEAVEGSARDILGEVELESEPADADNPADALRSILSEGPMTGKEAKRLMADNGYSPKQIRNAREKLGVKTRREGFGKDIQSFWELSDSPIRAPETNSCPTSNVGTNEEKGHEWSGESVHVAGVEEF
jgi:hypothetical protein